MLIYYFIILRLKAFFFYGARFSEESSVKAKNTRLKYDSDEKT